MEFDKNKCRVCGDPIVIQIFKGTGIGSDNCRKIFEKERDGDSDRRSN
jgi:predicted nucleic acid-binding Zn ribbon protein